MSCGFLIGFYSDIYVINLFVSVMARVHGKYGREIQNFGGCINVDFEELGLGSMSWIHLKII